MLVNQRLMPTFNRENREKRSYFDDGRYFAIDVVVGKVESSSKGALVEQWVLIKLNFPTGIPLIQTHCAICKIYHLPQNKLWSCKKREMYWIKEFKERATQKEQQ